LQMSQAIIKTEFTSSTEKSDEILHGVLLRLWVTET
jgi:hypothetical protein